VRRRVWTPNGKLLYDTTWYSNYVSSPKIVRVGPAKPKKAPKPAVTTTTTTPGDTVTTPVATLH
jgi:hypothetical protein